MSGGGEVALNVLSAAEHVGFAFLLVLLVAMLAKSWRERGRRSSGDGDAALVKLYENAPNCWRYNAAIHANRADPRCYAGGCTECCASRCRDAMGVRCGEAAMVAAGAAGGTGNGGLGRARTRHCIKALERAGWLVRDDSAGGWRLSAQAAEYAFGAAVIEALADAAEKQSGA